MVTHDKYEYAVGTVVQRRDRLDNVLWEAMCDVMPLDKPFTVAELSRAMKKNRDTIPCSEAGFRAERLTQMLERLLPVCEPGHLVRVDDEYWMLPSSGGDDGDG